MGVTTDRLVISRLDSGRLGQQLCGFHHGRRLKTTAQRARRDDKRRLRVALGKRVVFAMELRIRQKRYDSTSQARQQQLHEVRRIRETQQDAISSAKAAVSQHLPETRSAVMDLAMGDDARRIVGRAVVPCRFRCPLSEQAREIPIPHCRMTALALRRDVRGPPPDIVSARNLWGSDH
ncbi:hypothetical protein MLAC_28870 [Mycobacterium lacus]|uniref:Uncharacterized protein n=1 Tax=Mycobacterium lacus TaxID=169765 RepID=A0A7I7NMU0_9MYCO|nr:hypothetical protein MLAC_28870 [Mycobacterium lacus]